MSTRTAAAGASRADRQAGRAAAPMAAMTVSAVAMSAMTGWKLVSVKGIPSSAA